MRDQMHRKLLKRGFELNVMVVGEAGLGKSTLVDTLFCVRLARAGRLLGPGDGIYGTDYVHILGTYYYAQNITRYHTLQ